MSCFLVDLCAFGAILVIDKCRPGYKNRFKRFEQKCFETSAKFQDAAFMLNGSFSTREVQQLTSASARQLQWWDEHRLIVPRRVGRKRIYSSSDLMDILVVLELRRRHISLQQVRRVLNFLRKKLHVRLADLVSDEAENPLPNYHLLIDGKSLYLETDTQQIFDLLKNTEQAVFLISLSDAVKKLWVAGNALMQRDGLPIRKPVTPAKCSQTRKEGSARTSA